MQIQFNVQPLGNKMFSFVFPQTKKFTFLVEILALPPAKL